MTLTIHPPRTVDTVLIAELQEQFNGDLIQPQDSQYDEARAIWNGMIDRKPALIAICTSADDVVAAVNFARDNEILISVRGGGHNVAGHAVNDDGIVIDLGGLKQVEVDVQARRVRAGGGATILDVDAATQPYGLAVPMGVVSATGIAGLTLGGGYGWLRNMYGLSCDNLIGATVVTASGQIVQVSETENADLLWGLRGGGGNFGIVTEFVFNAFPLGPEVAFTFIFHDGRGEKMKKAMQFYREFSAAAPDEVSTLMALGTIPPDEHFDESLHHVPFVLFGGMYAGDSHDGVKALAPLNDFAAPLLDFGGVMPYVEAQQAFDEDYPNGNRYYWKSLNLDRLDDDVIDTIIKHARKQPSPFSTIDLWPIGGAVTRHGPEDGAFYGRQAAFMLGGEANWVAAADDAVNLAWLRTLIADVEQYSDGSRYLNFAGFQEEGDVMMARSFGPQFSRLAVLKAKYDPQNLFRLNQNIKPAS